MNRKHVWRSAFVQWLPLAIVIIMLTGLVYAGVQQNYRQSANDPQIQVAEDIVTAISQGTSASDIVPASPTTDIAASLSTFATMFDDSGKPIGSSVAVNGNLPTLPSGAFDYAKKHTQDRFTWQPKAGVRIAAVLIHYSGKESGYVLVGRSIREVEKREQQLMLMSAVAAAASLILSYLVIFLLIKYAGYVHTHEAEHKPESESSTKEGEGSRHSHHE